LDPQSEVLASLKEENMLFSSHTADDWAKQVATAKAAKLFEHMFVVGVSQGDMEAISSSAAPESSPTQKKKKKNKKYWASWRDR
jgi:hypothetical protein